MQSLRHNGELSLCSLGRDLSNSFLFFFWGGGGGGEGGFPVLALKFNYLDR